MKEKKFIKLKTDMYSDTKFKIIDTMEERDLINCIWTRLLTLCGRLGSSGELYLSSNIPYTVETLALEFNRAPEKVKLALDVFMDLEMIELKDNAVYTIKNFAKHQNIKLDKKLQEECIKKIEDSSILESNNKTSQEKEVNGIEDREKVVSEDVQEEDACEYILATEEECPYEKDIEKVAESSFEDVGDDVEQQIDGFKDTFDEEYNDEDINGFDIDRDLSEERIVKTVCFFGTQ